MVWNSISFRGITIASVVLFVLFFAVSPTLTSAQIPSGQSTLKLDPSFPKPNSTVVVSLDAYTMDTTGATITWSVDGVEMQSARNSRSTSVLLGDVGKTVVVSATVRPLTGPSFTVTKKITPSAVDIIIETDTHIPPFYLGRALPSRNVTARIIAIPLVGGSASPEEFTYRWEHKGIVLLGGPVRGKYAIELPVSQYRGDILSVTVTDKNGDVVGGGVTYLDPVELELYFYEENPLRGLSERAMGRTIFYGEEYKW
jgi:hypothetical protein